MHNKPHSEEAKAKMRAARLGKPAPWKHRETRQQDGVTLYRCGTCGRFLPFDGFYKTNRTLLGIKSQCKACHSECSIRTRDKDNHRIKSRERARKKFIEDPEYFRAQWRSRPRRTGPKQDARQIVHLALRIGALVKPSACEACGEHKKLTAHHEDYMRPLDVRWLCYLCHAQEHRVVEFKRVQP